MLHAVRELQLWDVVKLGKCLLEIDLAHVSEINLFRKSQDPMHVEYAVARDDGGLALPAVFEFERRAHGASGVRNLAH